MSMAVYETQTKQNHYNVLVVEDDPVDQMAIQRCLYNVRGVYQVDTVQTGVQAMDRLTNGCYDLITLDYHLPDGEDLRLLRAIRKQGLQVVFVTGGGSEKTAVQAMRVGILDYIIKDGQGHYLSELDQVVTRYFDSLDNPYRVNGLPVNSDIWSMRW